MKFKTIFLISFIASLVAANSWSVSAATNISLTVEKSQIALKDVLAVDVNIESPDISINAAQVKISISADKLKIKEIKEGDSIINYWATRPTIDASSTVSFEGVILNGFTGAKGRLLTIYYEAIKAGQATISIQGTAYLNDGKGTKTDIKQTTQKIVIANKIGSATEIPAIIDSISPVISEAMVSRSNDIYDGKYFLAFTVQDSESGIAYVEVKEGEGSWIKAESPYLLTNQKLNQDIQIKAVDNSGNESAKTLEFKQYSIIKNVIYFIALGLLILVLGWIVIKNIKK